MVIPEHANGPVVDLAECCPPRLAQPGNHHERGPGETTPTELGRIGVLEKAEQPELLAAWTAPSNLEVAAHRAVHRLPLAAARVLRRRRLGDSVQDGKKVRGDLRCAVVEKVNRRHAPVGSFVIDDMPGHNGRV